MTPQNILASEKGRERSHMSRVRGAGRSEPQLHLFGKRTTSLWFLGLGPLPLGSYLITLSGRAWIQHLPDRSDSFYALAISAHEALSFQGPCRGVDYRLLPVPTAGSVLIQRALARAPGRLGSLAARPTSPAELLSARSVGAAAPCAPEPTRVTWLRCAAPASGVSRSWISAPSSLPGQTWTPSPRASRFSTV